MMSPTNPDDLDKIIMANGKFSTLTTRRFIRFADTNVKQRTICPIAYLDGDLSKKHPRLRIQLVIITHTQSPEDKPECLLLRFETPEGADPAVIGKHDYYHSQICTHFQIDGPNNTFTIPIRMMWRAHSCPAWARGRQDSNAAAGVCNIFFVRQGGWRAPLAGRLR
jgi:hypothetical protein